MKRLLVLIVLLPLFISCAGKRVKTDIVDPKGNTWIITSKTNAVVEIRQPNGAVVKIDNRGQPTFFETYMQYMLFRAAPTVAVTYQNGSGSESRTPQVPQDSGL